MGRKLNRLFFKEDMGFSGVACGKRSTCQCRRCRFGPWVGKILWRREWQSTPVFLPGEFCEQRSLAGYSPWGCKESDMTEPLTHTLHLTLIGTAAIVTTSVATERQTCSAFPHRTLESPPASPSSFSSSSGTYVTKH